MLDFIEVNNISHDQSAYLRGHSTQTSLHRVMDDWLESINEGDAYTHSIFILEIINLTILQLSYLTNDEWRCCQRTRSNCD